MAVPKVNNDDIIKALKFIDENGVPSQNRSTKWELVTEDGKKYPPKYVIAVAEHIAHGTDIVVNTFNAVEAKDYLMRQGYDIQEKVYTLTITADEILSTDDRFTMDNIRLGDNYKAVKSYLKKANGEIIERKRVKGEWGISGQTMPLLAFQVFEKEIDALSVVEKENFPICKYSPDEKMKRGIYLSENECRERKNLNGYGKVMEYNNGYGKTFAIEGWNLFSTITFVQECLKRFGEQGDKFVLEYKEKGKNTDENSECEVSHLNGYKNRFSQILIDSKNIIFHGAPGTGKTYLAKQIAADIISGGETEAYSSLTDEQKKQFEFVQFHPSYDYTDFIEGLRPKLNGDGTVGFELQDGTFKKFVDRARENQEKKYIFVIDEINRGEISKIFGELFFAIDPGYRGSAGKISTQYANLHKNPDEKFYVPENVYIIGTMNDIDRSVDSFDFAMRRRFRFIELKAADCIDMLFNGLVDSELAQEAKNRMTKLNAEIAKTDDLNENYQIGAAYFLKLKEIDFDMLWTDYLQPLLREYVQGMNDENEIMRSYAKAYGYNMSADGDDDETTQDKG